MDRQGRRLFAVVFVVGCALRAWQLLAVPPLWLDELALANGLLAGGFGGLFDGPSDFAQIAPPGFLVVEWILAHLAPASDLAVRLQSFVLGCASLWSTWLAARELVGERDAWIAPALVALGEPLIMMSGQVKPYAADVFFASLVVALALRYHRHPSRDARLALVLVGAAAPLFSLGTVFVLSGAGACLLLGLRRSSAEWKDAVVVTACWAAAVALSVGLASRLLSPATDDFLGEYWRGSFPVFPPGSASDLFWPFRSVLDLLWTLLGLRGVGLSAILIAIGAAILYRRSAAVSALLVVPFIAAMAAAALRLFPFGIRLSHWTAPILALLLTVTLASVAAWLRVRRPSLSVLPAALAMAAPLVTLARQPPPYLRDDVRPLVQRLSTEGRPGDIVYVYWGAWHAWQRYGGRVAGRINVVEGGCPTDYPRGYLEELDQLRGTARAWFLFGRFQSGEERDLILRYLGAIGTHEDSVVVNVPGVDFTATVELHRYDLSDTTRLARATAAAFAIRPALVRRETGCRRLDAMLRRGDGTRVVRLH